MDTEERNEDTENTSKELDELLESLSRMQVSELFKDKLQKFVLQQGPFLKICNLLGFFLYI